METTEVRFNVPSELAEHLEQLSDYGYQSFVLRLYLEEEISFGKAATLLRMPYDEFMDFLGQRKIPYFRHSIEEVKEALRNLHPL
jgi:hypothetical protein